MSRWHLYRPPQALRRRHVQLDNVALVPASHLPRKATYQALANTLPPGAVRYLRIPERFAGTCQFGRCASVNTSVSGARTGRLPEYVFNTSSYA